MSNPVCKPDHRGICQTDHRAWKPAVTDKTPPKPVAINVVEREGG